MEINDLYSTLNLKEKSQRKTKRRIALCQMDNGRENHVKDKYRLKTQGKGKERDTLFFIFL